MERKPNPLPCAGYRPFRTMFGVGAALVLASSAPAQNLFISNGGSNGSITEITPGGVQSTFVSGLLYPTALACDNAGNLFVAVGDGTPQGGRIVKVTPSGVQSDFASGLNLPVALACNAAGDLFAATLTTGNIYEFSPGGVESTFATGLMRPSALAFNSAGDLFVAIASITLPPLPTGNGAIVEFTPGGGQSTFASGLGRPQGLAFNSAGNLFVSDGSRIYQYMPDGSRSTFATFTPTPPFMVPAPKALAFNGADELFVTVSLGLVSPQNSEIDEFMPDGVRSTFASGFPNLTGMAIPPVPEPAALGLLFLGAATLLTHRRSWLVGDEKRSRV